MSRINFFKKIDSLNFSFLQDKLCCDFEGPNWNEEQWEKAFRWYKRFLYLTNKYREVSLVPTKEIDEIWHFHILDTIRYFSHCEYLFGEYLHHAPSSAILNSTEKHELGINFNKTIQLFKREFNETPQVSREIARCSSNCMSACGPNYIYSSKERKAKLYFKKNLTE